MTIRGEVDKIKRAVDRMGADKDKGDRDPHPDLSFEELRQLPLDELYRLYRESIRPRPSPVSATGLAEEVARLRKLPLAELVRLYRSQIGEPGHTAEVSS